MRNKCAATAREREKERNYATGLIGMAASCSKHVCLLTGARNGRVSWGGGGGYSSVLKTKTRREACCVAAPFIGLWVFRRQNARWKPGGVTANLFRPQRQKRTRSDSERAEPERSFFASRQCSRVPPGAASNADFEQSGAAAEEPPPGPPLLLFACMHCRGISLWLH